jgi:hypothetical protein
MPISRRSALASALAALVPSWLARPAPVFGGETSEETAFDREYDKLLLYTADADGYTIPLRRTTCNSRHRGVSFRRVFERPTTIEAIEIRDDQGQLVEHQANLPWTGIHFEVAVNWEV